MIQTFSMNAKRAMLIALLILVLCGCPYFDPSSFQPSASGEHWLRFVQVTDIHVLDDESPARIVTMDAFKAGAWRPQEAYAAQMLDATCRLINRVHLSGQLMGRGPVDFVLVTGVSSPFSDGGTLKRRVRPIINGITVLREATP